MNRLYELNGPNFYECSKCKIDFIKDINDSVIMRINLCNQCSKYEDVIQRGLWKKRGGEVGNSNMEEVKGGGMDNITEAFIELSVDSIISSLRYLESLLEEGKLDTNRIVRVQTAINKYQDALSINAWKIKDKSIEQQKRHLRVNVLMWSIHSIRRGN